jgi:Kef-type K+ transport system membrane component KefB/nucleotide-binding universal stress UspA family protein
LPHLSDHQILQFLVEVGALLLTSRVLAELMKRIGQAAVVGELLAGVLLGPSLLGHFAPGAYDWIFPSDPSVAYLLEAVAWLGAVMLLLYVGLETDLGILRGMGRTVGLVSGLGVAIPMAAGIALGLGIPATHLVHPDQRIIFALFLAVAISISAVPVIAKILLDLGLMRRDLGTLILAAGIVDDTTGWLLLSVVAGLAERGQINAAEVLTLFVETTLFLGFCYFAGTRAVARILRWVDDRTFVEHAKFTAMVVIALGCAAAAQAIGLHAVFGAFIAGLMLTRSTRVRARDSADVEALASGFLAPIFFAYSGLRADFSALRSPELALVVLAVGCAAKLTGCGLGGTLGGLRWREALAVALGMNARGGMGIVVALVGLSLGVLTPGMYTVLLLFAVATSMMTPPLLSWALGALSERPSDAERVERDRLMTRMHFTREGAKLLVLSGGGPHADLAAHIAAALAGHPEASITVFRATAPGVQPRTDEFDAQFQRIKAIAAGAGALNVHQRTGSGDSIVEAIATESARGYDAIFAGASQLTGKDDLGGDVLRGLVGTARAPVVIARNGAGALPLRRVLAPTTGAAFSRLGATVAMHYARAFEAHITALYVREASMLALPIVGAGASVAPDEGREFVDEISRLGREIGVEVETRLSSGRHPEDVILATVEREDFDLLVMGVLFRSSDQRMFFGPKVREILRKAQCSVAVVVPPQTVAFRS